MYRILIYTRIKPRSRPPQKKNPHILRTPDFSAAKIGKNKGPKLREQIGYILSLICQTTRRNLHRLVECCLPYSSS